MDVGMMQYPPGDSRMIDKIVHQLKSQGIFDQFRKECLADVDTKPAYQNLHQRVEGSVSGFLASQVWRPDLNKNQLRDSLRKHIHDSGFLDIGVERIVDQVVNPKVKAVFVPQVEDVVYKCLGMEKPKKGKENHNVYLAAFTTENLARKEERRLPTLTDLLPKELEPISPESDTLKDRDDEDSIGDECADDKEEEDSSPPFEPIEEVNSHLESSMDSHLSGISELTSHDSRHSEVSFMVTNNNNTSNNTNAKPLLDLSNNDSQLSKVSSGSRLSIVSLGEHHAETNDESQMSKTSLRVSCHDTQMSDSMEFTKKGNDITKTGDIRIIRDISEELCIYSNKLQVFNQDSSQCSSDDISVNIKSRKSEIDRQEKKLYDNMEDKVDSNFGKMDQIKSDEVFLEKNSEIAGNKFDENEDKQFHDTYEINITDRTEKNFYEIPENKSEEKHEMKMNEIETLEKKINEKWDRISDLCEKNYVEMPENRTEEKFERYVVEKYEKVEKLVKKSDEKSEKYNNEKLERRSEEKYDRKWEDKIERRVEEKTAKKVDDRVEKKTDDRYERKLEEKFEKKIDDKSDRKQHDDRYDRKLEEKHERRTDDRTERKFTDKLERKSDDKTDKKLEEKFEKKIDEKVDKKAEDKSERKLDEKSTKKTDDRCTKKTDDKSEKRSNEKPEKKLDDKLEKKVDERSERKTDSRTEKKTDDKDKYDKKQDRHREDKEKSKEKKRLSSESKDVKKSDSSSHSSESDKRRSDKDKYKKERNDTRSKTDKSSRHDNKDSKEKADKEKSKHEEKTEKEKLKHEERTERDSMKEKSKQEMKENKDEKEKKLERDSSKERFKKEDENSKQDIKKFKNDDKKEKDGKEKQKAEEKVRVKHDDRHRERTKSENKDKTDKEKSSRHDDKSKDISRSSSKDSKEKSRQDKDKGKNTISKGDEKKSKEKSKHEDKTSKPAEKGTIKKTERKKEETDSSKSSRSEHKGRDTGKKGKENKGKGTTDDHRIHRDKRSEDRRSADRDSNGTAQDKSVGSTASRTNTSDSQRSQSRRDKTSSTSTSGSGSNSSKSEGGGNSESSGASTQTIESSKSIDEQALSPSKSTSPPSSLPFKKRPLSIQSEDEQSNDEHHSPSSRFIHNKIKKPKIAANIFEVKKIMMLRKSLAKKERKQQRELKKNRIIKEGIKDIRSGKICTKPVTAKRRKIGDVEKSLRKEINTSLSNKQMSQDGENSSEIRYFESEVIPNALSQSDSEFLAYVKRLDESDNLSEISTSDTASEASDQDDVIHLSDIDFDDMVAAELGARIIETDRGREVHFDVQNDKNLSSRKLPSPIASVPESFPVVRKASMSVGSYSSLTSLTDSTVHANLCDSHVRTNMSEKVESRPSSALSNWSERSDDVSSLGGAKRVLRQRSSSAASTTSNKSIYDKIEATSNGLNVDSKPQRKKVLSRKRTKKDIIATSNMEPPENATEKHELRRSRKPSTRYSSKLFASFAAENHFMQNEDLNCDTFSEERENVFDNSPPRYERTNSRTVVNDVSKNNSKRPISAEKDKPSIPKLKISATITHADEDSSDREIVPEPSAGDGYDIIRDNNNIDKGSSEDERGCGDGSMLNQDLILPTLRDLMVESGFRRKDDKSDILPSLLNAENLLVMKDNVSDVVKQSSKVDYESSNTVEKNRPRLGRSRRVGLGRPAPKRTADQVGNDVSTNRTVTPPSSNIADFVMPLSPESDVSASSGEAKKSLLDHKVGDSHAEPSPSHSEEKVGQVSNSTLGDTENRRSLRSGGLGTPAGRAQRYSSDDLYKPRPLFSQGSRRVRGRLSPPLSQEAVENCTINNASDFNETLPPSAKRRR